MRARFIWSTLFAAVLSIFLFSGTAYSQSEVKIEGIVVDSVSNEPVTGVMVVVPEISSGCITGIEGRFSISVMSGNKYSLFVQMLGYDSVTVDNVWGGGNPVVIRISPSNEAITGAVVKAAKNMNNDMTVTREIRGSMMVVSGVSGNTIARTQDRDAGETIRRLPGISVIDGRYLVARGLSQRYNDVWVDGISVPSSEADTRSFSFDMIPAGQVGSIMIIKSPVPEVPADFAGGFIELNTKDIPDKKQFALSYTTGINSATCFSRFSYNQGGSTGISGFDNDWSIKSRIPSPDRKFSFSYGKNYSLRNEMKLDVNGAINYSYASRTYSDMENSRYGVYNKSEDEPEYLYKYTDNQYVTTVKAGVILNFSLSDGGSRYHMRNLFNRVGQDKLTERVGWQNISSLYNQEKTEYDHVSRITYSGQFSGEHDLSGGGTLVWRAGYSYADKNQPDRRIVNRQENDLHGDRYYGMMGIDQNDIERDHIGLHEHMCSAGADYEGRLSKMDFKSGVDFNFRSRNYRAKAFYYRFNTANLPDDFRYYDIVDIMQEDNFSPEKLYIYDNTDNRDSYKGYDFSGAAYMGLNVPMGRWNIYSGARCEYDDMRLISYTRISEWTAKSRDYVHCDVFPSVNATYRMDGRNVLRFAYGMSTNRPEFREISSSVYYDFDLFSDVKGNEELEAAYIHNIDVRYEWYSPSGESFSLALFYKHFINPIETTFLDAGGSYTYTFENASVANAYGIEMDLKKNFGFAGIPELTLDLNGSLIASMVEFEEGSLEHDRPLQGQSPYLINSGLFYVKNGWSAGILYNRIGKRIVGIGKTDTSVGGSIDNDIPDMYEMPRNALDFVFDRTFLKKWYFKLNVKDLLDEDVVFCQFPKYVSADGTTEKRVQVTKRYKPGTEIYFSLGVRF
ncbi:MAG: carboxypeptidase-like regulatory domain-containing protein [Bacteroidales bacterium]|nr:carboxypeptidase-like regulatory domain-containing protein [Bacteroidales bacterium]MCI2122300.1 carboxypeptidase-like regulatory domain-containing protein [Bacteroidales bacterium]MCI2145064.1 carboxypeptidase-like regulatory domain-containing protein [Bacteroidales bacterium]